MDDERISRLEQELRRLTERIDRLERQRGETPSIAAEQPAPAFVTDASWGAGVGRAVPLAGRTFLVLGGAFAIRAVTDSGVLPKGVGVALGLVFAALWFALAHRVIVKQQTLSGIFHAVAGALIAFPLLVEATTRIGVLPGFVALAGVAAFSALLMGLAFRHRVMALAWVGELAGVAAVVWLLFAAGTGLPPTLALLFIGAAALVLADTREWKGLRWPVALVLDAVVLRGALSTESADPRAAGAMVLALVGLYFAAFVFETLRRGREAGGFEIVQTLAVLGVWTARAGRAGGPLEGAVMLAVAVGALAIALRQARVRPGSSVDLFFYSSAGLVLLLVGGGLLGLGARVALIWAALAVLDAWWGRRLRPGLVWTHAAVLSIAAAASSHLWTLGLDGIWASFEGTWELPGWEALLVLVAAGTAYALEAPAPTSAEKPPSWWSRVPSFLLLVLCVVGATGTAAASLAFAGLARDGGVLALVRTALLVGSGFVLALAHRATRRRELTWLAYAVVALSGLKLLVQDLPQGRAATLFAGFALFGASLIFIPRLLRPAKS